MGSLRGLATIALWDEPGLIDSTFDRLIAMGATQYEAITDRRGHGFVTASVVDPFGNILGIMTNPHYLQVLGK